MPWEITIFRGEHPDESCLGARAEVIAQLATALPGSELQRPSSIPEEMLAMMPEILRESMQSPNLEAAFEHPEYSISFYCRDVDPIARINAEVRGNGDPLAALRLLCESTGWSVWDAADQQIVDFTHTDDNGWTAFCEWRDRVLSEGEQL